MICGRNPGDFWGDLEISGDFARNPGEIPGNFRGNPGDFRGARARAGRARGARGIRNIFFGVILTIFGTQSKPAPTPPKTPPGKIWEFRPRNPRRDSRPKTPDFPPDFPGFPPKTPQKNTNPDRHLEGPARRVRIQINQNKL